MEAAATASGPPQRRGYDVAVPGAELHSSGMVLEPSPTTIEYLPNDL